MGSIAGRSVKSLQPKGLCFFFLGGGGGVVFKPSPPAVSFSASLDTKLKQTWAPCTGHDVCRNTCAKRQVVYLTLDTLPHRHPNTF